MNTYKVKLFNYDRWTYDYLMNFLKEEKIIKLHSDVKVGMALNTITFNSELEMVQIYEKFVDISSIINLNWIKDLTNKNKIKFNKHSNYDI